MCEGSQGDDDHVFQTTRHVCSKYHHHHGLRQGETEAFLGDEDKRIYAMAYMITEHWANTLHAIDIQRTQSQQ